MRVVELNVDQQIVSASHGPVFAGGNPAGVVSPEYVGNETLVRGIRVTHPNPQPIVHFDNRVSTNCGPGRYTALTRHGDAGAGRIELKPVVTTLETAVRNLAERQRQVAVTAPVLQRCNRPIGSTEKDDRLAQKNLTDRFVRNFARQAGDIPAVSQIHDTWLRWRSFTSMIPLKTAEKKGIG